MKKVRLAIVLSVIPALSIAAQTKYEAEAPAVTGAEQATVTQPAAPTLKTVAATAVKPAVETTPTTVVQTSSKSAETTPSAAKTGAGDIAPKADLLGGLSTGNPDVDRYIAEYSALYDVDARLIYAQMHQESGFRRTAVSPKGAGGFMQLMPDTARRFGATNVFNARQNIKAGIKYMRWLLDRFGGDTRLALAGYNAGEGAVLKHGNKVPPYRETQNYVARIMAHYELLSNQNAALARQ